MSQLSFTRQPDGSYTREGALPRGCRKVRIDADERHGRATFSARRAVEIIENAIAKGQARSERYTLIPAESALDEATRERLRQLRIRERELAVRSAV